MGKIYTFDIGTRLRMTLNEDITGQSSVEYKIKKPGGTIETKTCSVEDLGDGILYYDTITGDLDVVGQYSIQAQVVFSAGVDQFESETQYFNVYDSFK